MVDVKLLIINTLTEAFHLPIFLQGSMSTEEAYPESFFTFWNNSTNNEAFYDDSETQVIWDFDLNYYSLNPVLVNTVLLEAIQLLQAVGFIPDGSGYDVVSNEPTHTGRGVNLLFIQRK